MPRNLLPKKDLDAFLAWCAKEGIAVSPGTASRQVAHVRPRSDRDNWEAIYHREEVKDHLVVTAGLAHTVRRFASYQQHQRNRGKAK